MKLAAKEKAELIERHVAALHKIFPDAKMSIGPKTFYFRLQQLENEAHKLAEHYCNEPISEEQVELTRKSILSRGSRQFLVASSQGFLYS